MDDLGRDAGGGGAPLGDMPSGTVRDARPARDALAMETVRARVEQALFGAASHVRFGRYVIIDRIAGGGMGVVYRAEDPELHRKVALKVLHPRQSGDARARQRMLGEARALARLDHANVVQIHDVLTVDDQVVLVMELVDGATLASWERDSPRSWREIVRVYAQAGDGLVAAHGLDIIHRDFKPANVVIRDDGSVRVLDFGLARVAEAGSELQPALGSPDLPDAAGADGLTVTGEIVGTLGYTSPEQLAGQPATPASDQFSFCVALHRAIEGVPPFQGGDVASRLQSIRGGGIARGADERRAPAWLRAVIARGLASEPAARFPSMAALLAELRRPRGWRRWRTPIAVVTIVGVFAVVVAHGPSPAAPDLVCDGGVREVGAVWGLPQRVQLDARLRGIDSPYLASVRDGMLTRLDAFRDRWIALHRDACTEHRRGVQSATLLDQRMACMKRRLEELGAAVEVISRTDRATAGNVLDVVVRLPALDQCADVERLQAVAALPATDAQRGQVDAIRARLARAAALDRAGRSRPARDLAKEAADEAERVAYAPLIAEATLLHGTILLRRNELAAATAPLARARAVALAQRLLALAVEAGARQLHVEARQNNRHADLLRDAAMLEPISRGLPGDHFARPLLLSNIGTVHLADGDRIAARRSFEEARAALQGVASPDLELTCIDQNLAMLTPEPAERIKLARGVWERRRDVLGEQHLTTLEGLDLYARFEVDPRSAYELIVATCAGYDTYHPELVELRANCNSYRAFLADYQRDSTEARVTYAEVARLVAAHPDPAVSSWGQLATGHARRLEGDAAGAIAAFIPVARAYGNSPDWWMRYLAADAELGVGLAEQLRHNPAAADPHLRRAAELYDDAATHSEKTEFRLRAARARAAIALRGP
jgi:predicted Ser/Thr protein kinase